MLGQPHAVDADHGVRLAIDARRCFHIRAVEARTALQLVPVLEAKPVGESLEAVGVLGDEGLVQHGRAARFP